MIAREEMLEKIRAAIALTGTIALDASADQGRRALKRVEGAHGPRQLEVVVA